MTCAPFLQRELVLLLPSARSFLVLGNFAWTALLSHLIQMGFALPKPRPKFGHGASFTFLDDSGVKRLVIASYHPSQQNTFTGKLTESMLDSVVKKAKAFR